IWTNTDTARDTVTLPSGESYTSEQATIWRWRKQYQNDFAARMNWCVADTFDKANHNPIAILNGDPGKRALMIPARSDSTITLSADGTRDPDGNNVHVSWWIYEEAGTARAGATLSVAEGMKTDVHIPKLQKPATIHVILQAEDDGAPHLFAYRRAVLEVSP